MPASAQPVPGFEPTQRYTPTSQNALAPGTRLNDYEIVKVLGEGGFSIVYLAQDLTLQRRVAIKEYLPAAIAVRGSRIDVVLRTTSQSDTFAQGLSSFVNEARLLARFDHPSLVRVLHFWKANGTAYMVMPYVEGRTLAVARAAMAQPPDEAWLRALLQSLLGALEVLHAASCFHRDIAPDNVLLLPDGRPLLLDFGAARRVVGERTQQLTAILKPHFAPIEQYAESRHLQQGPWTDLYALGALARYCVTGQPPVPSTVRALHDELPPLADEVRALRARHPDIDYSATLLGAIDWALGVRPVDRPQSVARFREALEHGAAVPPRPAETAVPPRAPAPPPSVMRAVDDDVPLDVQAGIEAVVRAAQRAEPRFDAASTPPAAGPDRAPARQHKGLLHAAAWAATFVVFALAATGAWRWYQLSESQHAFDEVLRRRTPPGPVDAPLQVPQPLPALAAEAPPPAPRSGPANAPRATLRTPSAAPVVTPGGRSQPEAAQPAGIAAAERSDAVPQGVTDDAAAAPTSRVGRAQRSDEDGDTAPRNGTARSSTGTPAAAAEPDTPRAACAPRQQFALYYCMQQQCQTARFYAHPQCVDLRRRDEVE